MLKDNFPHFTASFIASLLPFLHLLAQEEPSCPSVMKKCELAVRVAFPWTENVKVAETEPVLALASPAPSHIICTFLENAITVGRLPAYFIYWHVGLRGN